MSKKDVYGIITVALCFIQGMFVLASWYLTAYLFIWPIMVAYTFAIEEKFKEKYGKAKKENKK